MTDATLFDEQPEPIRPYWQDDQPSSGWSGSDTSKDAEPDRLDAQQKAWLHLRDAREKGLTWSELVEAMNLARKPGDKPVHHGTASSALSNLHQAGHAARLTEKRFRSKVYVLPAFVGDRDTERFKQKLSRKDLASEAWHAALIAGDHYRKPAEQVAREFDEWWELHK